MYQVLIVDDEPFMRQGLKVIIDWESYGFTIADEAKNGLDAYELLKKKKYDLLILDIKMPGMTGLELAAKVRTTISKRLKIVLLSGYSEFSYATEAMKYNIGNYLLKPIQPDELVKVLKEVKTDLERFKKADEMRKATASVVGSNYLRETLAGRKSEQVSKGLERAFRNQSALHYLHIEMYQNDENFKKLTDDEQSSLFWKLYDKLTEYMEDFRGNCICNVGKNQQFEIGIIISEQVLKKKECATVSQLEQNLEKVASSEFSYTLSFYMGEEVESIKDILTSYLSSMDKKAGESSAHDVELLSKIERELRTNYQENLSLKELSEKYYINSAYLGQLFKKKYGIYFKDYLNLIRVERAKELLLSSNEKVYKISELVGYNNVDYFINKFTKLVGITPSRYRNQNVKK